MHSAGGSCGCSAPPSAAPRRAHLTQGYVCGTASVDGIVAEGEAPLVRVHMPRYHLHMSRSSAGRGHWTSMLWASYRGI